VGPFGSGGVIVSAGSFENLALLPVTMRSGPTVNDEGRPLNIPGYCWAICLDEVTYLASAHVGQARMRNPRAHVICESKRSATHWLHDSRFVRRPLQEDLHVVAIALGLARTTTHVSAPNLAASRYEATRL
jgi:hypothetical protein